MEIGIPCYEILSQLRHGIQGTDADMTDGIVICFVDVLERA